MRKVVCLMVASTSIVIGCVSFAAADDLKVRFKWRSCDTLAAGLAFRTTFFRPAGDYGEGRYLIKSQIRWDKHTGRRWRQNDVSTNQSDWRQINKPGSNLSLLHGDRTDWNYDLFKGRWRAHVIVKLIKNRPGPRDKKVATVERFFEKPMFEERGEYCQGGTFARVISSAAPIRGEA